MKIKNYNKFSKKHKFYCQICKKIFTIIMQNNGDALLSCACDNRHSKFLWLNINKVWLVWDENMRILAHPNENIIGCDRFLAQHGGWRKAIETDKLPIILTTFIFR